MKDIVVIGAGKIGSTIARMLAHSGDYRVTVADRSEEQLAAIERHDAVTTAVVDIAAVVRPCTVIKASVGLVHLKGHRAVALADEHHAPAAENVAVRGVAVVDFKDDIRRAAARSRMI